MGLAATLAGRSLLGRPGRTLFSVLGVAVGIATVVCVFTVDHVSVLSRTIRLDAGWGADLEVRPSAELDDPRDELLRLEGVAGVAAFFHNDVGLRPVEPRGADDAFQPVHLVALDADGAPGLGVYHVDQGEHLDPDDPSGILVTRRLAEEQGLALGDRVFLLPPARAARSACVDGELQDTGGGSVAVSEELFRVVGLLAHEGIARRSQGRTVVIDHFVGKRLFRDLFVESRFWVRRSDEVDVETLEARLGGSFTLKRNARAAAGQMADERAFRNGVRVAGLFALLLGLFVIFHTLSMSLVERIREVSALSSLGTTPAQIARIFFAEALVVALAAGGLGLLGGLALARVLLRLGISTLGVVGHPVGPFDVPWRVVATLTGLGVGIALVGAVYPILRVRGTNVVAVLRGEDAGRGGAFARGFHVLGLLLFLGVVPGVFFVVAPVVGAADPTLVRTLGLGFGALALVIGLPVFVPGLVGRLGGLVAGRFERRFPLAGRLAARSLAQNPTRVGASIAAIALVTAAFTALEGMTRSLAGEIEHWAERAVVDKVWLEGLPDLPLDELVRELGAVPGVLGIEPGDIRVHVDFLLLGVRPDQLASYGPAADDPALLGALRDEQALVVSRRLARQRGLEVDDALFVNTSGHGVQQFRVAAISDAYGYFVHPDERAYAVTNAALMKRYFCLDVDTASTLAVRLERGADPAAIDAWIHERFGGHRVRLFTGDWVRWLHLDDLARDFVLFDIILGLTAVLAGLGVLNGLLLAALERRKELGVLRALGVTQDQLAGTILLEAGVIGALGGLLGVLVGWGLIPTIVSALRVLSGLDLPIRGPGSSVVAFFLGALVLALAAGLYPIWRMGRMDAVRAVRTG